MRIPQRLKVVSLAAGDNAALLAEQVARYRPTTAPWRPAQGSIGSASPCRTCTPATLSSGAAGLVAVATHPSRRHRDLCLRRDGRPRGGARRHRGWQDHRARQQGSAGDGGRGSSPTLRARRGVTILPVDSEHNAIHQCLHGRDPREIRRLILTASGGPFREHAVATLERRRPGSGAAAPDVADGAGRSRSTRRR